MRTRPLLQPLGLGTKVPSRVTQPSMARGETACSRANRHDRAVGLGISSSCAPFSTSRRQSARAMPKVKRTFVRLPRKVITSGALRTYDLRRGPERSQQPPIPLSGEFPVSPTSLYTSATYWLRPPPQPRAAWRSPAYTAAATLDANAPWGALTRPYSHSSPPRLSAFPPERLEFRYSNVRKRRRRRDRDYSCARGTGDLEGGGERGRMCESESAVWH